MEAVILAGGLGTRLASMVSDRSKVMAEIGCRPFVERLVLKLQRSGIRQVVFCVGHRAGSVEHYFGDGSRWGLRINYSTETDLLGTAGALKRAEGLLTGDNLLVLNGDSFFDIDLSLLNQFHRGRDALGTIALLPNRSSDRYGAVELGDGGRVLGFREKPDAGGSGLISGGMYVFRREVLSLIPESTVYSLERNVFPALVEKGRLFGLSFTDYFIDIGIPDTYASLLATPEKFWGAVEPT